MTLMLYVTDARPAYQANLLAAMASPIGAHHVFRHGRRWIDSDAWDRWSTASLGGTDVVVAYLTGNVAGLPNARTYPVRAGVVVEAERAGDHGLLTIKLGGWCGAAFMDVNLGLAQEVTSNRGPRLGSFVLLSETPLKVKFQDEVAAWSEVAEQLRVLPEFESTPMLSIHSIRTWPGCKVIRPERGQFRIARRRSFEIDVIAIAPKRSSVNRPQVRAVSSTPEVRIMTNAVIDVGYRFTRSQVVLYVSDEEKAPTADVTFFVEDSLLNPQLGIRLRLKSSLLEHLNGLVLPGGSAAIATGAGVLPQDAPFWLKVVMVLIGSAGVGIATFRAGNKSS